MLVELALLGRLLQHLPRKENYTSKSVGKNLGPRISLLHNAHSLSNNQKLGMLYEKLPLPNAYGLIHKCQPSRRNESCSKYTGSRHEMSSIAWLLT